MNTIARKALEIAKNIQAEAPLTYVPPSAGTQPRSQNVLPRSMVTNTRGYIVKVVDQINGCYEKGWFDGCAVMMRRLLETLILECFEANNIAHKIKNPSTGDFLYLSDLISQLLKESTWNLGRNTKKSLLGLKSVGDKSAHSRRYNAYREDIDKLTPEFRTVCQELLYLANLR